MLPFSDEQRTGIVFCSSKQAKKTVEMKPILFFFAMIKMKHKTRECEWRFIAHMIY